MKCPYCGFEQKMPLQAARGAVEEIPIEEGYARAQRGLGVQVTTLSCKECGATVNVSQGERTAACAFCGSHQVLQVETDGNAIRPESLVAFQIDKANANTRFGDWLKGLWFRPNDLKKIAKVQEMGGVYVPFWTFDAHVDSDWTAEAGYYYYETEEYTTVENGESVTRTRQVQYTRWEPAWGRRHNDFYDDTLICASKGLPGELVEKFSTFNTQQLVPYAPQYLAGWRAEAYAVDLMAAHAKSVEKVSAQQVAKCARDVPGDTHRGLNVNNHFYGETFKHILLPIWIAAYRYNNKVFRFLVNGQTGEVVGKAPWSVWKILLFSLFIAAIIGVIAYFVIQQQEAKQERKKKSSDTEEEAPKKKKSKKKSTDDDGYLDPHRFRRKDGAMVVVPV